jgi:hypothetical protein
VVNLQPSQIVASSIQQEARFALIFVPNLAALSLTGSSTSNSTVHQLSQPSSPVFAAETDNLAFEVAGHSIWFFAKKNGVIFRDEFQLFALSSLVEMAVNNMDEAMSLEHPITAFSSFAQDAAQSNLYRLRTTLLNGAEFEMIVDVKPPPNTAVKYAMLLCTASHP